MRQTSTYSLLLAAAMFALPGCGQGVPRGDLGSIIYRLPDVPGADQPYELPELKGMKSVDEAAVEISRPAWSSTRPKLRIPHVNNDLC